MAIFIFLWAGFCPGRLRVLHFLGLSSVPLEYNSPHVHLQVWRPGWSRKVTNLIFWMAMSGIIYMADPTSRTFLALTRNKTHGKQKAILSKVSPDICCETHSPSPALEMGKKGRMGTVLNWLNLHINPYVILLKKEGRKKKTSICNRMKSGKMGPKTLRNSKQLWEFWAHKP